MRRTVATISRSLAGWVLWLALAWAGRALAQAEPPTPSSPRAPPASPASSALPERAAAVDPAEHWAYRRPVRPVLPEVGDRAWPRNAIDRFVLARLEREQLPPTPEADRATLLRRVSLDLTGLPPTLEEVLAFERDATPDAYERLVDRLLASPHHGEQRARYWLDLARYADTNGYNNDAPRPIWRYRDWVIGALNRDLPFDQFTVEQLAGDLLPQATEAQRIATGFHRNTLFNGEGGADPEEFRVEAVVDRVETTATIWLATTLGCARCHDHPHDPFTQREFFQLFAFFNGTADTGGGLLAPPTPFLYLPSPEQGRALADVRSRLAARKLELGLAGQPLGDDVALKELLAREQALLEAIEKTMVLQELPTSRTTRMLERGDFLRPREVVQRATPQRLPPRLGSPAPSRLDLARWLVDPRQPIAARAAVNRLWENLFGAGLVATVDDFGLHGERPAHPELLDWLAIEFVERGWSQKELLRLIVTSATYRQASAAPPELWRRDPDNRLLARGPRRRLDAETLRDLAQAAAGLLDPRIGGPSVFPPQPADLWRDFDVEFHNRLTWRESEGGDRHRRGLYTFWRRTIPYPTFTIFDAPARQQCTARRQRTITPQQALAMLNDPAFAECAVALARRMLREGPASAADKLEYGFRLCLARRPTRPEMAELVRLIDSSPIAKADSAPPRFGETLQDVTPEERPWALAAAVLLNLDATLSNW